MKSRGGKLRDRLREAFSGPASQHLTFTLALVAAHPVPEGARAVRVLASTRRTVQPIASSAAIVQVPSPRDEAVRVGSKRSSSVAGGDGSLGAVWDLGADRLTFRVSMRPDRHNSTGRMHWRRHEISVRLQLQRTAQPGSWHDFGRPIVIDLANHATEPVAPGSTSTTSAQSSHMYTPLRLEWAVEDPQPCTVVVQAHLECVPEGSDGGAAWSGAEPHASVHSLAGESLPSSPGTSAASVHTTGPTGASQGSLGQASPTRPVSVGQLHTSADVSHGAASDTLSSPTGPAARHSHNQVVPFPPSPFVSGQGEDSPTHAYAAAREAGSAGAMHISTQPGSSGSGSMPALEPAWSAISTPRTVSSMPPLEVASSLASTPSTARGVALHAPAISAVSPPRPVAQGGRDAGGSPAAATQPVPPERASPSRLQALLSSRGWTAARAALKSAARSALPGSTVAPLPSSTTAHERPEGGSAGSRYSAGVAGPAIAAGSAANSPGCAASGSAVLPELLAGIGAEEAGAGDASVLTGLSSPTQVVPVVSGATAAGMRDASELLVELVHADELAALGGPAAALPAGPKIAIAAEGPAAAALQAVLQKEAPLMGPVAEVQREQSRRAHPGTDDSGADRPSHVSAAGGGDTGESAAPVPGSAAGPPRTHQHSASRNALQAAPDAAGDASAEYAAPPQAGTLAGPEFRSSVDSTSSSTRAATSPPTPMGSQDGPGDLMFVLPETQLVGELTPPTSHVAPDEQSAAAGGTVTGEGLAASAISTTLGPHGAPHSPPAAPLTPSGPATSAAAARDPASPTVLTPEYSPVKPVGPSQADSAQGGAVGAGVGGINAGTVGVETQAGPYSTPEIQPVPSSMRTMAQAPLSAVQPSFAAGASAVPPPSAHPHAGPPAAAPQLPSGAAAVSRARQSMAATQPAASSVDRGANEGPESLAAMFEDSGRLHRMVGAVGSATGNSGRMGLFTLDPGSGGSGLLPGVYAGAASLGSWLAPAVGGTPATSTPGSPPSHGHVYSTLAVPPASADNAPASIQLNSLHSAGRGSAGGALATGGPGGPGGGISAMGAGSTAQGGSGVQPPAGSLAGVILLENIDEESSSVEGSLPGSPAMLPPGVAHGHAGSAGSARALATAVAVHAMPVEAGWDAREGEGEHVGSGLVLDWRESTSAKQVLSSGALAALLDGRRTTPPVPGEQFETLSMSSFHTGSPERTAHTASPHPPYDHAAAGFAAAHGHSSSTHAHAHGHGHGHGHSPHVKPSGMRAELIDKAAGLTPWAHAWVAPDPSLTAHPHTAGSPPASNPGAPSSSGDVPTPAAQDLHFLAAADPSPAPVPAGTPETAPAEPTAAVDVRYRTAQAMEGVQGMVTAGEVVAAAAARQAQHTDNVLRALGQEPPAYTPAPQSDMQRGHGAEETGARGGGHDQEAEGKLGDAVTGVDGMLAAAQETVTAAAHEAQRVDGMLPSETALPGLITAASPASPTTVPSSPPATSAPVPSSTHLPPPTSALTRAEPALAPAAAPVSLQEQDKALHLQQLAEKRQELMTRAGLQLAVTGADPAPAGGSAGLPAGEHASPRSADAVVRSDGLHSDSGVRARSAARARPPVHPTDLSRTHTPSPRSVGASPLRAAHHPAATGGALMGVARRMPRGYSGVVTSADSIAGALVDTLVSRTVESVEQSRAAMERAEVFVRTMANRRDSNASAVSMSSRAASPAPVLQRLGHVYSAGNNIVGAVGEPHDAHGLHVNTEEWLEGGSDHPSSWGRDDPGQSQAWAASHGAHTLIPGPNALLDSEHRTVLPAAVGAALGLAIPATTEMPAVGAADMAVAAANDPTGRVQAAEDAAHQLAHQGQATLRAAASETAAADRLLRHVDALGGGDEGGTPGAQVDDAVRAAPPVGHTAGAVGVAGQTGEHASSGGVHQEGADPGVHAASMLGGRAGAAAGLRTLHADSLGRGLGSAVSPSLQPLPESAALEAMPSLGRLALPLQSPGGSVDSVIFVAAPATVPSTTADGSTGGAEARGAAPTDAEVAASQDWMREAVAEQVAGLPTPDSPRASPAEPAALTGVLGVVDRWVRWLAADIAAGAAGMCHIMALHSAALQEAPTASCTPGGCASPRGGTPLLPGSPTGLRTAARAHGSPRAHVGPPAHVPEPSGGMQHVRWALLGLEMVHESLQLPVSQAVLGLGAVSVALAAAVVDTARVCMLAPVRWVSAAWGRARGATGGTDGSMGGP